MSGKYEVLAPVGYEDALQPMIDAGADAVYVGLKGFSSRPSEIDFTLEQIENVIKKSHAVGVKVYTAINVNVSERHLDEVKDSIFALDSMGVDAVILAELGLVAYLSDKLRAAIHASTLLGAYNIEAVKLLKSYNVSRIILYANLYADEIAAIINAVPDMEYELVAEGGTCFNDIRQCLLPHSYINGEHKLFCREAYDLVSGNNICRAKPICEYANKVAEVIGVYMGMGITSFKIEGRTARYQERVPMVERVRKYIDMYEQIGTEKAYMHYFSRANREVL